jgi:adenine-specific DNA-methyltransferase
VEMSRMGASRITAVDNLESNCVILRAFFPGKADFADRRRMPEVISRLNGLRPRDGYITENFSGTYFTRENCRSMDAIREEIASLAAEDAVSRAAHDYLLASFLLAADSVANTIGQYDAFLKNIDSSEYSADGRHLVDERVRTAFRLRELASREGGGFTVLTGDMLLFLPAVEVDVAYFDPPYNGRQYCDNYHVLENLVRWEKPPVFGKTRKFDRAGLKSPFSRRRTAEDALRSLLGARTRHIFLSYSSEGIVDRQSIQRILSEAGTVTVHESPYPVFGNGAGVSRKRSVIEYLFHVRVKGGRSGA